MQLETGLLEAYAAAHPDETAQHLQLLPPEDAAAILAELPPEVSAAVVQQLMPLSAARSLEAMAVADAAQIIQAVRKDTAATVLRLISDDHRSDILRSSALRGRNDIMRLLQHPAGTAGSMMDPEVASVLESASVADALDSLRAHPQYALHYVYVVDLEQRLAGVVNLLDLVLAMPDQPLRFIANASVERIASLASWESIIAHKGWRYADALPVVDAEGRLIGVIRQEYVRKLEESMDARDATTPSEQTSAALGELYGLALRGVLHWATELVSPTGSTRSSEDAS